MVAYSHTYPYMQDLSAQEVHKTPLRRIFTLEAGACCTKLIQLQYSAIQLLCKGLLCQPNYPDMRQNS